tara:strand:- start:90 stop:515 length:426 start_codon:yes stop_codon:yes gene_type:complete
MKSQSNGELSKFLTTQNCPFKKAFKGAKKWAEANGFKEIGKGSYKLAYSHWRFPTELLKLRYSNGDCQVSRLPERFKPYYVWPSYNYRKLTIQKKITEHEDAYYELCDIFEEDDLYSHDIHDENCGYYYGKPYFYDFRIEE